MEYVVVVQAGVPIIERARQLEEAGWGAIGIGDHRMTGRTPHVWAALGAMAAATTRVRLLPTYANNLFRHPLEAVQGGLAVQQISGGRFELGLGAGWHAAELAAGGEELPSPRERVDRFVEAVRIARSLLSHHRCHIAGRYYRVAIDDYAFDGPPPPLVAAVGGPRSCRLVAPHVDRVEVLFGAAVAGGDLDRAVFAQLTIDELRRRIDIVREVAPRTAVGVGVFVAAGDSETVAPFRAIAGDSLQGRLVGEPAAVADAVRDLGILGIDRVCLIPLVAGTTEALGPLLLGS